MATATRLLQRSPIDLSIQYLEVNFDDISAELARVLEAADSAAVGGHAYWVQRAATHMRQLIRGLIPLRGNDSAGLEPALAVVDGLPQLSSAGAEMLRARIVAVVQRSDSLPRAIEDQGGPATTAVDPFAAPSLPRLPHQVAVEAIDEMLLHPRQAGEQSNLPSLLQALVFTAVEELHADICQVFLAEHESLVLRAEAPSGVVSTAGPSLLSPTTLTVMRCLAANGPILVSPDEDLEGPEMVWRDHGLNTLAMAALGSGHPRIGLVVVGRRQATRFDADELAVLNRLAVETSLAMASAALVSRAEELAVLRERMKLAREIHDGLASDLSAVVALFKYHEHRRAIDPADADRLLGQMRELVEASLKSARDILATLRPRTQETADIATAVRRQTEDFARIHGVTGLVTVMGDGAILVAEERDAIYQVLREGLTNVRKHADASVVQVTLDMRTRPFTMVLEDDGVGFDFEESIAKPGSYGLLGMRERAELVGGSLEVEPGAMGGSRLCLRGPVTPLGAA